MTIKDTIGSYRKRRERIKPLILGSLAVLLVIVGIVIVVTTMRGGGIAKLIASKTPTPTITPLPTDTPTLTETPTVTLTPTITPTVTASAPENYIVQEGDNLTTIMTAKNLGADAILLIYILNPLVKDPATGATTGIDPDNPVIYVGQTIILPNPGMQLPTSTPIPTGLAPGTRITYRVISGDSLGSIANKFNSTVDAIVAANKSLLPDGVSTVIQPGWNLVVPINLVTPVPTKSPTFTPTATP